MSYNKRSAKMGDFKLFLSAMTSHWIGLMAGIVSLVVGIVERLRKDRQRSKLFWSFALLCIFFSAFQAWKDEHGKAQEATKKQQTTEQELINERAANSPNLVGAFDNEMFSYSKEQDASVVVIQMNIRNLGSFRSMADQFTLVVTCSPLGSLNGVPVVFQDEYTFADEKHAHSYTLHHSELITEKCVNPIEPGGFVRGWLAFTVPGANLHTMTETNWLLIVGFSDVHGKRTSITNSTPIPYGIGGFVYKPGAEYPLPK